MEKTLILRQQTTKLAEVLEVLRANFTEEELGEEIAFLTIVKEKIEEEAARQASVAVKADGPESEGVRVYAVRDTEAIEFIHDGDIEGFRKYVSEESTVYFSEPECFATEAEAIAYCAGIEEGIGKWASEECYPLRSSEDTDLPFIEAIENS